MDIRKNIKIHETDMKIHEYIATIKTNHKREINTIRSNIEVRNKTIKTLKSTIEERNKMIWEMENGTKYKCKYNL